MKDPRIDRAIGVCKKVVSAFSFSWKKRRDMAVLQAELGLPSHNLITESLTRWGSRQLMVERLLEQEKAIAQVLGADKKSRHLVPTWQDIDVLESINKAVSPLKEFTDALSGEAYVSVSYLKPVIHLLNNSLLQPEEGTPGHGLTHGPPVPDNLSDDEVDGIKKRAVTELMSLPAEKSTSQPGTSVQDLHQEEAAEPVTKKKRTLARGVTL
nr:zinc finger BED domain-containing protein 4-like isoform X2 [Pseudochaenichthys georgianus]